MECQYSCLLLCIAACASAGRLIEGANNVKVPALFTFGDSIVDPGNNNFIHTAVKANHPPYGLSFIGNRSTGRCSNGKLSTDFIAAALGLKETVPPYLDPHLTTQDLLTGVSFASAGSGYDNLTAKTVNVIPMWKQVELFKSYKARLEDIVGAKKSSDIISRSIFLVVAGTNDFVQNYFYLPERKQQFNVEQYQDFLLQICSNFVEELYKLGVRKIGVYGVPPTGCLPIQKAIAGKSKQKGCINAFNQVGVAYNTKLKATINRLRARLPGVNVVYVHIYGIISNIVKHPSRYGFETSSRGCCGTGLTEICATCNRNTPVTCKDPSKYVFWDAVHLTERAYKIASMVVLKKDISKLL